MTEPLDFTAAGRKKSPGPPQSVPPRRPATSAPDPPSGRRASNARIVVVVAAAVVVLSVVGFAVFGRSGKTTSAENPATVARYCQLAQEFDTVLPATALGAGTADTSAGAVGQVLRGMGGTIQEMEADAPAAIRADVSAVVATVQAASAGNPAGLRSSGFLADRQRITSFEEKMCNFGAGSNEQ